MADLVTELNPLTIGMPTAPVETLDKAIPAPEPVKLAPAPEQTRRQDSILGGLIFGQASGTFPMPGAMYGAVGGSFYNGFGAIGVNSFGVPLGSYANYWLMERNPTVAITEAVADAPIRAAEITYEAHEDTPQEVVDFIREAMTPWERPILDGGARARAWGVQTFELVYKVAAGKLIIDKAKPLAPELTTFMRDDYGNIVSINNQGVILDDMRRVLRIVYDERGTMPYGRSRRENIKKPWLRQEALYDMLEYSMNIQVRPFGSVTYPYGLKDTDGNSLNAALKANAEMIGKQMAAGLFAAVPNPNAVYQEQMIEKGIDPSKCLPYQIDWYDAKTDSGAGFQTMFSITDKGIVSGLLQPPRAILEAEHGSKADAEQGSDSGILINEIFLALLCREVSRQVIDTLLTQNFGEEYRGCVWWKPSPMVDRQLEFNNALVSQVLGSELGPFLLKRVVELAPIFEKAGVKVREFDQDKLMEDAEKEAAEKRQVELDAARTGKGNEDEPRSEPLLASLSTGDAPLATITTPWSHLTKDEQDRRKRLLLALLGFFTAQADDLQQNPDKDPSAHTPRLANTLSQHMNHAALAVALAGDLHDASRVSAVVTRDTGDLANRLATMVNATTAKNLQSAIDAGQTREEAIDSVLKKSVESRASAIEDDATFLAGEVGRRAASELARNQLVWITSDDERVCGQCGPLHGLVANAGEEFAPGIRWPVLDTHSRCRCMTKAVPVSDGA